MRPPSPGPAWAPELLKSKAYEQILLDIILGDLPPGALLEEAALAARTGAGLAGVRDALNRLALEGFVVRRPRVGTVVSPLDLGEIEEAFEVRRLLEGRSAALAARHATPADALGLLDAFAGAEAAVERGDARALIVMDRIFHRRLAWATRNAVLARYLVVLQDVATRWWVFALKVEPPEEQLADIALHRDLALAVAARDAAAAEAAMARLIGDPPSLSPAAGRPALAGV